MTLVVASEGIPAEEIKLEPRADGFVVMIASPNVARRLTTYDQVEFILKDIIRVSAGGCVQTGTASWKPYVGTIGPESQPAHEGLIKLPGMDVPMRLSAFLALHQNGYLVPESLPLSRDRRLHLGYDAEFYDNNGYWGPDRGARCADDAWIRLEVTRAR